MGRHRRMIKRRVLLATGAAATVLGAAGCSQHYNGSLGVASQSREAVAYREAMQQRDAAMAAGDPARAARPGTAAASGGPVAFQSPGVPAPGSPASPAADDGSPRYTSDMARQAIGPLGLFGQIQTRRTDTPASPLDGSGDIVRVTFTTEGADFDPDVDPTGQWLVYASTRHRDTADLYLKNVRGTAVTQLTNDPANEVMPVFSPDGQRIAFASDRAGKWDIYVMDVRGGQPKQITNDATHDIHPSWSPDGRHLVYCAFGAPSGQWEMIIVDVDNPTTRRVIGHGLFPKWSPSGDKIAFQRARQRGTRWFSIWTMGVTADDVTPPTEIAVSSNAAVITPRWSPDGRFLVFCTVVDPAADEHTRPSQADIWVVSANGANRTRLTEGRFANLQPVWASDNTIYFVSNRGTDGVENIWAMQGRRAMELARPSDRDNVPSAMVPTR